jgi:hypothetical protein
VLDPLALGGEELDEFGLLNGGSGDAVGHGLSFVGPGGGVAATCTVGTAPPTR